MKAWDRLRRITAPLLANPDAATALGVDMGEVRVQHAIAAAAEVRDARAFEERHKCTVCGKLDRERGFDYMVRDSVWAEAGFAPSDFADVLCLEERLGRRLTQADFRSTLINSVTLLMMRRGGLS